MRKSKFRNLKEWNGLKIKYEKVGSKKTTNALYNHGTKTITLYDNFFTKDLIKQEAILEHEWAHYIWYKMPKVWQLLTVYLHRGTLNKSFHILGDLSEEETKLSYINNYAKKNTKEDFAEHIEAQFLIDNGVKIKKMSEFVAFKHKKFNSIFNHYDKKFGNRSQ